MDARYTSLNVAGFAGRGGSSIVPLGNTLFIFGGADRTGALYDDLIALRSGRLSVVQASGTAVDSRSGLSIPAIGGHSAAGIVLPGPLGGQRMATFGGIDFVECKVLSCLVEYVPAAGGPGRWRALGGAPSKDTVQKLNAAGAGKQLGEPRLVLGDTLPGGRTGHTMSTVPPPVILRLSADTARSGAQPTVRLDSIPGYDGPIQLKTGQREHASCVIMFGGSTPDDGPLNDVWLLRAAVGADSHSGGDNDWSYEWLEIESSGPQPKPRELHAAWVRPAVVQLVQASVELDSGSAWLPPSTEVRIIHPAALCVYGGRGVEDPAPTSDLVVMSIQGESGAGDSTDQSKQWRGMWRPLVKTKSGGHAAAASSASPNGLHAFLFGGQARTGDIHADLWHCDARNGVVDDLDAQLSPIVPGPLDPATWTWTKLGLKPAGDEVSEQDNPSARFAACAACTAVPTEPGDVVLSVFGGMTVLEDSAELLLINIPLNRG